MPEPKNKPLQLFEGTTPYTTPVFMAGIASPQRAYKLCWHINNLLGIELARIEDLFFRHKKGDEIFIQCFEFDTELGITYRLLANKTNNNILIPEHKNTGYFLLVKGEQEKEEWELLLQKLKEAEFATAVYNINILGIKNKDILYF